MSLLEILKYSFIFLLLNTIIKIVGVDSQVPYIQAVDKNANS
jgi:hypothetical protein